MHPLLSVSLVHLMQGALIFGMVLAANNTWSIVSTTETEPTLEIIILHNNDIHARFDQTDEKSATCSTLTVDSDNCFGGIARISTLVKKYRSEAKAGGPHALYLNAGDTYTGTPWFTIFKDKIAAAFLNILKPDAIVSSTLNCHVEATQ